MNHKKILIASLILMSCASANALPKSGPYLGVTAGYGFSNSKSDGSSDYQQDKNNIDNSGGFASGIFAGYNIQVVDGFYIAPEVQYLNINSKTSYSYKSYGVKNSLSYGSTNAVIFDAKLQMYVTDNFSIYGKFGAALTRSSYQTTEEYAYINENYNFNESKTNFYYALGASYSLTDQWALNLEYDHINGIKKPLTEEDQTRAELGGATLESQAVLLGLQYTF